MLYYSGYTRRLGGTAFLSILSPFVAFDFLMPHSALLFSFLQGRRHATEIAKQFTSMINYLCLYDWLISLAFSPPSPYHHSQSIQNHPLRTLDLN